MHLVNPILDDRSDTKSATVFTQTPFLNRELVAASWKRYLPDGNTTTSVYATPGRLSNFAGLPSAYVEVAQRDPLRDEGIAFANRLLEANVDVELHLYPGTFHGSEMLSCAEISRQASSVRTAALRRALARRNDR
jgi:acetyl esterase/lipase